MSKIILEFDGSDDELLARRAINATGAYCVLHTIMEDILRRKLKYGDLPTDHAELLETVREEVLLAMDFYKVTLDDLE